MRNIKYIFVHCTATVQHATVKAIEAYWKNKLGWKSPGYHKIIEAGGKVRTLLNDEKVSNGVKGYNSESLHVSYVGGVINRNGLILPIDTRTPAQLDALEKVVRAWHEKYPEAHILGHRDISPDTNGNGKVDAWERIKECPSFEVSTWLTSLGIQNPPRPEKKVKP